MFDEWLSPDVVNLLIAEYAEVSDAMGALKWEYSTRLPSNTWGWYSPSMRTLYVNQAKTKNLFKQQVNTILHEIEHWNQHIKIANGNPRDPIGSFGAIYKQQKAVYGYWDCPMEVDARRFADLYVDDAMGRIGTHYSGKVEGGSFDLAIEELFDEYEDVGFVTRVQIGTTLKDHGANSPENMKAAISTLGDLGIKVR